MTASWLPTRGGNVTVLDPAAEKTFHVSEAAALRRPIASVIPDTGIDGVLKSGKAEIGQLQTIRDGHILTNRIPITIDRRVKGVVAMADPTYAAIAPIATIQVAASVIVTAILTPILTSWMDKRVQQKHAAAAGIDTTGMAPTEVAAALAVQLE